MHSWCLYHHFPLSHDCGAEVGMAMSALLAVDLGVKTGLALYGQDGRLLWYRSQIPEGVRRSMHVNCLRLPTVPTTIYRTTFSLSHCVSVVQRVQRALSY